MSWNFRSTLPAALALAAVSLLTQAPAHAAPRAAALLSLGSVAGAPSFLLAGAFLPQQDTPAPPQPQQQQQQPTDNSQPQPAQNTQQPAQQSQPQQPAATPSNADIKQSQQATPSENPDSANSGDASKADQAGKVGKTDSANSGDSSKAQDKAGDKSADAAKGDNDKPLPPSAIHDPILWRDPGNIASKDLFNGQGGPDKAPKAPFTFLDEDMNGTNPKFNVKDANGKKWRVKLGEEPRPEVVASRLMWAMGYFTEDDYLLPSATIDGLHVKRGSKDVGPNGEITDARFARKPGGQRKIGIWEWKNNPFTGTREFNGLRVMMALMNNWDLKDVNNSIYNDEKTHRQVFLVSDIGATFATNKLEMTRKQDKGNIESFEKSKFITKTTDRTVDFGTPAAPTGVLLKSGGFLAKDYVTRKGFEWIGRDIPREDVRWIAKMLSQLSHQQIADAFRAGHFPPDVADMYVVLVENRIHLLGQL